MRDEPPRRGLSVLDGAAFVVGIVVGVGLFRTPPLVAAGVDSGAAFLGLWALGAVAALAGALCYAELSSAYPDPGGEYRYLTRAFGRSTGLFFVWARGTVIQTGSVAVVGFVYGEYANQVLDLGRFGTALHAAAAALALTLLNLSGRRPAARTQVVFTSMVVAALIAVVAAALAVAPEVSPAPRAVPAAEGAAGMAMIFVLLTYGGWNEAAYLAGEVRRPQRDMVRILVAGVVAVAALYLVVNAALLAAFGLEGLRGSEAVAADLMRMALGDAGAVALSLIVCAAALSTMNATLFTGARLYYAIGRDLPLLARLGVWRHGRETPSAAFLLQGGVALALIAFGAGAPDGFRRMVDYTAPVFWFFMVLIGLSLFVLRRTDPDAVRPFRVPLYPLTPLVFIASAAWLLHSSIVYTGIGALLGLLVLLAGAPFVFLAGRTRARS